MKRIITVLLCAFFTFSFAFAGLGPNGILTSSEGFWGILFNNNIKLTMDANVNGVDVTDPFICFQDVRSGKYNKIWTECMANPAQYQREYLPATNKWQWTIKFFPHSYANFFNLTGAERFAADTVKVWVGSNEFSNQEWPVGFELMPLQFGSDAVKKGEGDIANNGLCIVASTTGFHPTRGDLEIINTAEPLKVKYWTLNPNVKTNPRFFGINGVYSPSGQGEGRELTQVSLDSVWTYNSSGQPLARKALACYEGTFDLASLVNALGGNDLQTRVEALNDSNQQVRFKISSTENPANANADLGRNYWITYLFHELDSCRITPQSAEVATGGTYTFSAQGLDENLTPINSGINYGFEIVENTTNTINNTTGLFTANEAGTFTIKCTAVQLPALIEKTGFATIVVNVAATPVALVEISPSTASININGTQQFAAIAKNADGEAVTEGVVFGWAITESSLNTISPTGLFTGNQAGTFHIACLATQGNVQVSGTAEIVVNNIALLDNVVVAPTQQTIYLSQTAQFTATGRTNSGAHITEGITYQWQVENTTNTVEDGLFTANETGTFTIRCTAAQTATGASAVAEATVIVVPQTGINKIEAGRQLTVYPNPAVEELIIDLKNEKWEISNDSKISIYDASGKEAGNFFCNFSSQVSVKNSQLKIDVSTLKQGMYILLIDEFVIRFIKK